MRCPKCGYTSFDYLKQCSKCQTDLTGERTRLNLLEIRPNPISLKDIMDRVSQKSKPEIKPERERAGSKPQSVVQPEPEITLGDGLSLEAPITLDFGAPSIDPPITLDLGAPSIGTPIPQKEEKEIELFLEELDFTPSPKNR